MHKTRGLPDSLFRSARGEAQEQCLHVRARTELKCSVQDLQCLTGPVKRLLMQAQGILIFLKIQVDVTCVGMKA